MDEIEAGGELEEISESGCLELLERHRLGRLAIVVDGQPQVFPVNYAISGGIVSFRTGRGTKLANAPLSKVAFEIDGYEVSSGIGWSVMVQGIAQDASESFDDVSWEARRVLPKPLAPGVKEHRIAIRPTIVTGRRFRSLIESGSEAQK